MLLLFMLKEVLTEFIFGICVKKEYQKNYQKNYRETKKSQYKKNE